MIKKNLNFEYTDDFVDEILDRIYADEDLIISIVGKFDEIKDIIRSIAYLEENFDFEKVDIASPLINGYEDEYVMDIFMNDDGVFFDVEPIRKDGHIRPFSNDENYIFDTCGSKILDKCDGCSDTYIVHIGEEDEFEDEDNEKCSCPECKVKRDLSNADKTGKTEYRVNGKSVSKTEYDKAYKDFHEEYVEMLTKMFKNQCELIDEVNNSFARLRMW